ncbi:MAG: hypothetical protein R2932_07125 [Caldilineaceae bacterium]
MTHKQLKIQLEIVTQKQVEVDVVETFTENLEFLLRATDFEVGYATEFEQAGNIIGVLPYEIIGGNTGYELHRLQSMHQFHHDRSDAFTMISGQLTVLWFDSDEDEEPLLLTYPFGSDDDKPVVDHIPNKPPTTDWQILLKQFSANKYQLIFIDPEGSGHIPAGPCAELFAKLKQLENDGETDTNDYRTNTLLYKSCQHKKQNNHG